MTTITLNGELALGQLLQMFRQMSGIDQTEMGQLIGASRPTISAWERGMREPSFSQVVAWARITGQPLDALIDAATPNAPSEDGAFGGSVHPLGLEPRTH